MYPTKKSPKISNTYFCENCDYICSKKSEYNKHILTNKHKILQNPTLKISDCKTYECICGKRYKHSSTLYAHKKKCPLTEAANTDLYSTVDKEQLIMMIIKQNSQLIKETADFKNLMLDVIKNGTHNVTNNNNNSHNKSFNLHFFLNETCKNAMNITDFIDSLQLQLTDLEKVGEMGYIEGISTIIIKSLNALDVSERPIHCTDKKRETMYVKDEDKWEKEDEQKVKMHRMVKKVANKNINLITSFQELHPEYKKITSKYADQYNKIIIESMGGKGDNEYEKEEKIIKKIAKEVFIEKNG